MKVCRVKVRVEPEESYWQGQKRRLQRTEEAFRGGKPPRVEGAELVFASLADMARALTPKRLEVLRLIRRHQPSSVRELAAIAGRDLKNVLADVKALEALGLPEIEGPGGARRRKAPRTGFGRIDVRVEL
jgi:predicted transcriptional regulator